MVFPQSPFPLSNQRLYLINTSESGKALVARNQTLKEKKTCRVPGMIYRVLCGETFLRLSTDNVQTHTRNNSGTHSKLQKEVLYLNQIALLMLISRPMTITAVGKHTFLSHAVLRLSCVTATLK